MRCYLVLFVLSILLCSCKRHRSNFEINRQAINESVENTSNTITIIGSPDTTTQSISISKIDCLIIRNDNNPILPTNIHNQIITRNGYITSYNKETKCPNWIAWHLTAEHSDGECPRDNAYYEDEDVPLPRATNEDYKGSGWSRGHMCPAGDNKWDETAMRESNLLTNICPQDKGLNSGVWNKIEQDCRKWAKKYGDVYIVCGPIFLNKEHETIGANKVVVPEAFFKVILCLQGKPKAIGFVVRNNGGSKKRDSFINTVDDVERITGIDFFPALPDDIEDEVEANANINDW